MSTIEAEPISSIKDEDLINTVKNPQYFDVLVIGGGVAGLTAGMYAARDGFTTLVLEGTVLSSTDAPGGALLLTSEIANFPGYPAGDGLSLITQMRDQCVASGALIREDRAISVTPNTSVGKCHIVETTSGKTYGARTIIIATGSISKRLNVPGEDTMFGRGVSTCATCDGFFFREKTVAVVGGGDTAVEDALLLTNYAEKVYLIVRGTKFRSNSPEARDILAHPDVEILWETHVEEIFSDENNMNVIGVSVVSKNEPSIVPVDGLFVAVGSYPSTQFLIGSGISLDEDGYVKVKGDSTAVDSDNINGIFAVGDVADKVFRQAVTSAGKAAQAAIEVRHYLSSHPDMEC